MPTTTHFTYMSNIKYSFNIRFWWPPESYIERIFNVRHISKMSGGGHFAALEKPRLLIEDIRKFFKKIS